MAPADNFHSQLVGWTKILLPLAALALLSTMFLFARSGDDGSGIPIAEITELAQEQRITAPAFSGVTDDGSVLVIGARSAKPAPDNPDILTIDRPSLSLDASDGTSLTVTAGEGLLDNAARTASLTGLARLETSSGFSMETRGLSADLITGEVRSDGQLAIIAPFGEITAGQVSIFVAENGEGQQMTFTGGVKLVYDPPEP